MKDLRVNLDLNKNQFSTSPKILIAGCGTGQDSLRVASSFQNSSVLAVDLSLSSLSYAIRKTKELSVTNIDYMQGDILKLGTLDRKFDIIESAGVLHHMEEPLVGWQVLVDLLKPQGLMRIALYSEIARKNIVEIREFIAKKGYDNSPKDIREFRAEIMNMSTDSNSRIQTIINSKDFYSLSPCRDLLFHVQEHRFTLPQIANALEKMGLIFIGFDCGSQIENQFKAQYPSNEDLFSLQLWHQFEQDHPDTFVRMYQFWVQKK
jgi:ubiquinone/menaquinone biosynthesis C-methylase UbiE